MGGDKPVIEKEQPISAMRFSSFLAVVAFLVVVAILLQKIHRNDANQSPGLSKKEQTRLDKRLKEIDDSEQYALIAMEDGWYLCNHTGRTSFYLLKGEVWKYGTTTKGLFGRYSIKYLAEMNVSYFVQFRGTISECLKEEQRKLFNYPYLPESLARPMEDRLPRPPYNSKMQ
jgi:hypothetical protein